MSERNGLSMMDRERQTESVQRRDGLQGYCAKSHEEGRVNEFNLGFQIGAAVFDLSQRGRGISPVGIKRVAKDSVGYKNIIPGKPSVG